MIHGDDRQSSHECANCGHILFSRYRDLYGKCYDALPKPTRDAYSRAGSEVTTQQVVHALRERRESVKAFGGGSR